MITKNWYNRSVSLVMARFGTPWENGGGPPQSKTLARGEIIIASFRLKTFTHRVADDAADDRAGDEFGEPMDADGDTKPDIERIGEGGENESAVAGMEGDQAGGHGEGHGVVGGRPTPEQAAFKKTQLEAVAALDEGAFVGGGQVVAFERWREAASEGFVAARYS